MKNANLITSRLMSAGSDATAPIRMHGKRNRFRLPLTLVASSILLAAWGPVKARAQAAPPKAPTDATFTFTADIHTSFNFVDDHQGIMDDVINQHGNSNDLLLIQNETAPSILAGASHHDGCVGAFFSMEKDLCNQIQLVRKLNHLPTNIWSNVAFQQNGHPTRLASANRMIGTPLGLVIAGDLTDCGGGSNNVKVGVHEEDCDIDYGNGLPGAQLRMFQQLFDNAANSKLMALGLIPAIQGLKSPDQDVPLKYPIYPHLGNHDLGFDQSGLMMNYVKQWNFAIPPGQPHHVTNNDFNSSAYSWDWGHLHIVNVGVFAGSSNTSEATDSNYAYTQEAMDWLQKDLATFAGDGRPVIICQHFGFDPYSYSSNWYLGSSAIQGAQNIWAVLAPYNVVGIFHGHHHEQQFYSFRPNDSYAGGSLIPNMAPRMAYDVFEPGPGYGQDFAVIRVTDNSMDVQATAWNSDFDNTQTTVQFVPSDSSNPLFFSKRLVQTPSVGSVSAVEANDSIATSVLSGNTQYLVGSKQFGQYTVRIVNSNGSTTVTSTGNFTVQPKYLTSFTIQNQGYILASDGDTVACYVLVQPGVLKQIWTGVESLHSLAVVYSQNQTPYMVADEPGANPGYVRFAFFKLSATKMDLVSTTNLYGTDASIAQLVPFSSPIQHGFGLIRYISSGAVGIYSGSIDNSGDVSLSYDSAETWQADSGYQISPLARQNVFIQPVALTDGSVAILVKSPSCLLYDQSNNCANWNNQDSPYSVRTLTQDGKGTEISWRGTIPALFAANAVSAFPLASNGTQPVVGLYSSDGYLTPVTVNGKFE